MRGIEVSLRILLPLLILATIAVPAQAKGSLYQTGFVRWRAADAGFQDWTFQGVSLLESGDLTFISTGASYETDLSNFYNGGSYWVGEATSPELTAPFAFSQAIPSWNASTPAGTWIEILLRVDLSGRWTNWYNLGVWASTTETIERHSVQAQGDADGYVATDTWIAKVKKDLPAKYQLRFRLFSEDGFTAPTVRNASLAFSTTPEKPKVLQAGDPAYWGTLLAVPECSQMVYADGGEVWCSPTSTSMVLAFWNQDTGPCEQRVRAAVAGVYDKVYNGHGNWPFNTAYAAAQGYEAYVARFTSLAQVEPWVAAGVPVVVSFAWSKGDLTGAAIDASNGHLAVVVGFDASGNPIVNDPAAPTDDAVQRTYLRTEFESLWLEHSGGTSYLIYPESHPVPTEIP